MNYKQEVLIHSSADKVFDALTQEIQKWWGYTDVPVSKVGDEFTTSFGPTHWKFKITEYAPGSKVSWKCIDAVHIHPGHDGIEKEWVGTTAHWDLIGEDGITKIQFTHEGLTEKLNCYKVCEPAWDMFITSSLKLFVETGEGSPYLA